MPQSDYAIEVTLRSIDGRDEYSERKILLAPNSKVHVGRSSKSIAKNLFATPTNAYIDSPVISREHALLSCNSSCGIPTIYLQDIGSMHGTMVNKVRLEPKKSHQLKNGDLLQFGNDVVRDNESFYAKKFRFESKPAASPSQQEETSYRAFSVPEAETSEDDEEYSDDEVSIVEPVPQFGRPGSQANPYKIIDCNEGLTLHNNTVVIDVDADEKEVDILKEAVKAQTHTHQPENKTTATPVSPEDIIDFSEDDIESNISDHELISASDNDSDSCKLHPYVEDADEDSENEERLSVVPMMAHKDEPMSVHVMAHSTTETRENPATAVGQDAETQHNVDKDSDYDDDAAWARSIASDGLDDELSEDTSDDEDDVNDGCLQRLKMLEMLNAARQGEADQKPPQTIKLGNTPEYLSLPKLSMATIRDTNTLPPEPNSDNTHSSMTLDEKIPSRPSGMSMSLRNIMASEKEPTPVSRGPDVKDSSHPAEKSAKQPESWTPKPTPPKEYEMKHVDLGHFDFADVFEQPWNTLPAPSRPVIRKHVAWGGDVPREASITDYNPFRDESWWSEPKLTQIGPYHSADMPRFPSKMTGDHMYSSSPLETVYSCHSYLNSSPTYTSLPALTHNAKDPALSTSASEQLFIKSGTPQLTSGFAPAMRCPNSPPLSYTGDSKASPSQAVPKTKTGMTIPEIVEDVAAQPATPTSMNSLKRKAEALESENTEAIAEVPVVIQETCFSSDGNSTELQTTSSPIVIPTEPPKKRQRLQLAATALAGAVVGGIGVLGALIALPDSFFQ